MMKSADKTVLKRREFFKAISIGAVVASTIPLAAKVRADSENNQDKRKARYRETDHVKQFYASTVIPTRSREFSSVGWRHKRNECPHEKDAWIIVRKYGARANKIKASES